MSKRWLSGLECKDTKGNNLVFYQDDDCTIYINKYVDGSKFILIPKTGKEYMKAKLKQDTFDSLINNIRELFIIED